MPARIPAVTGVLLIALLVPAAAEAATIAPLKPCYVTAGTPAAQQREGVGIQAAGFTPNSTVSLAIDGQVVPGGENLQVDANGNLTLQPDQVQAPFIEKGSRQFSVTLTQTDNPANTVTATSRTTALAVTGKPRRAPLRKRILFRGRGFTADKPVYAHYVYKGRLRKTVRMARKTGTCGTWRARRRQIPLANPAFGVWTIQFDQSKKYIDATDPNNQLDSVAQLLTLTISRVRG
jgi:hypothetical protein